MWRSAKALDYTRWLYDVHSDILIQIAADFGICFFGNSSVGKIQKANDRSSIDEEYLYLIVFFFYSPPASSAKYDQIKMFCLLSIFSSNIELIERTLFSIFLIQVKLLRYQIVDLHLTYLACSQIALSISFLLIIILSTPPQSPHHSPDSHTTSNQRGKNNFLANLIGGFERGNLSPK